jgi:hypothetical protein
VSKARQMAQKQTQQTETGTMRCSSLLRACCVPRVFVLFSHNVALCACRWTCWLMGTQMMGGWWVQVALSRAAAGYARVNAEICISVCNIVCDVQVGRTQWDAPGRWLSLPAPVRIQSRHPY